MRKPMSCIKIIKNAYNDNVVGIEKLVDKKIRRKAESILQKRAERLYNKIFR